MSLVQEWLGGMLILAGAFFCLTAGIGLLRLPEFFTRSHGAGVMDSLGAGLIALGLMVEAGLSLVSVKLLLVLALLLLTGPSAIHALARAALHSGLRPGLATEQDKAGDEPSKS
jgi:multicomponent Na+:H+ antiporter subunit G